MAKTIKGITIELEGKTSGLVKSLYDVDKQLKSTQDALKQVDKALELDPKNVELIASKQKLLTEAIEETKKKLDLEKEAAEKAKAALEVGDITEADYATVISSVSKTTTELEKLEDQARETDASLDNVDATSIRDVGDYAATSKEKMLALKDVTAKLKDGLDKVSRAARSFLTGSINSAIEYEDAFVGVMKTVDETATTSYDDISEGIKQMATETASGKEAIAEVAEVAGQLGVSADNLLGFTKTMVMLGDTTDMTATDAAAALAQFMNITGSAQGDVDKLGSAIVALGNNFQTNEPAIVEMAQRLAASGTIAGMSETDILALATAMSSVGIQAEAGGTAMTQTLTNISKKVGEYQNGSEDALDQISSVAGMSAKSFADTWQKEPIKALQAFISGLGKMNAEGINTYNILGELNMSGIRQSNMLQSLSLAADVMTDAVELSNEAYAENNALQTEASKLYNDTAQQVHQAQERIDNLKIEIGEKLVPILEELLGFVKDVVDWFSNLDDGTQNLIIGFAAFAAVAGPIASIIGGITSAVKIVTPLLSASTGLGAVLTGLTAPMGPVAVAIAGFVALAAAIAGVIKVYNDWERTKELQEKADQMQANVEQAKADLEKKHQIKDAMGIDYSTGAVMAAASGHAVMQKDPTGTQIPINIVTDVKLDGEIIGKSMETKIASFNKRLYGGT